MRRTSFDYIADYYGKRFKRGMRVRTPDGDGVSTRGTNYVWVRLNGHKNPQPWHPDDVNPITETPND